MKDKKAKVWIWVLIVLILFILMGVFMYVVISGYIGGVGDVAGSDGSRIVDNIPIPPALPA